MLGFSILQHIVMGINGHMSPDIIKVGDFNTWHLFSDNSEQLKKISEQVSEVKYAIK